MRKTLSFVMGLALAIGICGVSYAADEKTPEDVFKKMDKDSDGKISLAEFKGKREGDKATKAEGQFKKLDTNNDGSLSLEEFKARKKK